jgi:hypothetical protein
MNATKHLLFVIGIIGIIGAFVPLVEVKQRGIALELTAKELSLGLENVHKAINYQLPAIAEAKLPPDIKSARDDVRLVAQALKFSLLLYIPIGIILLMGVLAQYRGVLTRGSAAIAALAGIVSAALWYVVNYALDYGLSEIALKRTTITLELGAHILLVAGVGAALAGIVGVVRPEVRRPRRPPPPTPGPPMAVPPPPGPPPPGPAPYAS